MKCNSSNTKTLVLSVYSYHRNTRFDYTVTQNNDDHFGKQTTAKVFHGNKLWMSHLQYHLHHAVRQKCPEAVDNAITMHDKVITQSADTVNNVLWHWECKALKHPPSISDLSAREYNLLLKLKQPL